MPFATGSEKPGGLKHAYYRPVPLSLRQTLQLSPQITGTIACGAGQHLRGLAGGLIIRATPGVTPERAVRALQYPTSADQAPDSFILYRALRCAVDYETNGADSEHGGICRK